MRKSILFALAGLVVVGCSGGAGTMEAGRSAAKTYTFELNPKPNQQFVYDVTMDAKGPNGQPMKMEMGMTMTTQKVESDKVTFKTEVTKMLMNGAQMPGVTPEALKAAALEQVLDKRGKLISQKGGAPGMDAQNPAGGGNLPDKPVKVGDTWTTEYQGIKGTSKLVSVTNEGGREIANIEVTLGKNDKIKASKPFQVSVDLATGMTVKGNMAGIESQGMSMDMVIQQTN
jgi:hypothetical protein